MKVPILNIYYLLCYAWDMWEEGQLANLANEPFESFADLLILVLNSGVAHVMRRGLDRNYVREEDDLRSPRGKLDLATTLKRTLKLRSSIHCVYDEFSYDVLHNQIIKATLHRAARRQDVDGGLRAESVRLYRRLHEVSEIELAPATFERVVIDRKKRFYAFLVEVCRILYKSLLLDEKTTGGSVFPDFLRDEREMARLFERFVRNFYQREQQTFRVSAKKFDWMDVVAEPEDRKHLPTMNTDITLESCVRTVVIDTKYYASSLKTSQFGTPTVDSANLYQIFAYLKNLQKKQATGAVVEGILLYPVVGQSLDLRFQIHGHPLRVATVNLDQHWSGIKARLLKLVGVPA